MLTEALAARSARDITAVSLGEATLAKAYTHFQSTFDRQHAGFGQAPRFPMGHNLSFLLRYAGRDGESEALMMVERSLNAMADGGMYDQIGGGFHRYSTDDYWRIPHFEKMLYDQAILSKAYMEAYQATGNDRYADIARETLNYVLRDMTDARGGFYSAEDADSPLPEDPGQKSEGAFYLWTNEEVLRLLGEDAGNVVIYHFGLVAGGNAIADPHGEFAGKNVLYRAHTLEETARHFDRNPEDIHAIVNGARAALFAERAGRPRPHLDDKILTDWNGLMISSFAAASRALGEPAYRDAAERSARFILENLVDDSGNLLHRHRDGASGIPGTIEDYAFFMHGLIDLYEATFDATYLAEADRLAALMRDLFWDDEAGGFFFTADGSEDLIIRTKEVYDGAIPSGNSVAALDLIRLGRLTAKPGLESLASDLMGAFSADIAGTPGTYSFMLMGLDFATGPAREIIIAEGEDKEAVDDMAGVIYARFIPNKVVVLRPAAEDAAAPLIDLAPFLADHRAVGGKTSVYVCMNYACTAPTSSAGDLEALLGE
jgi:uncharacterized protein YyaL (SSP411 family)